MAAVTQQIPNFLGGVSRQLDTKKLPGQVTEILNAYPDPAFGLIKRNGSQFLFELANDTSNLLTDGFWFDINRDDDESYLGVITKAGDIRIWNLIPTLSGGSFTWTECTIANKSNADVIAYLSSSNAFKNLSSVTYLDRTYLINKSKVVQMQAKANYTLGVRGTVIIALTGQGDYVVTLDGVDYSHSAGGTDRPEHILNQLATAINAAGYTTTVLGSSMEITRATAFTLSVNSGNSAGNMTSYQDVVASPSFLSADSVHNRRVKVLNSLDDRSSYFVKFVAQDGVSGDGYWEESLGWDDDDPGKLASAGFNATTMPYMLVNTGVNSFSISAGDWAPRLTGSDASCPIPSFVGSTINYAVLNSNRLAFLGSDSVVLSVAKDISNFFYSSAQTVTASDPIDVDVSSARIGTIHSAISKPQGLLIFSQFEQFLLYSESGNLTPFDSVIRTLGQYENASDVTIKDAGPYISFISRTPLNSKVFGMQLGTGDTTPNTTDISQVVAGYLPNDVDRLITDPQNSVIAVNSPSTEEIFLYKFYNNGQEQLMQAWFKWTVPGEIQYMEFLQNILFVVTKSGTRYNTVLISLVQDPFPIVRKFGEVPTNLTPITVSNTRLDFFYQPAAHGTITYNAVTDRSTLPKPFVHIAGKTAVAIQVPEVTAVQPAKLSDLPQLFVASSSTLTDTGFILEIDTTDWTVQGDWTGYEDKLIVGYEFNYEVELPAYHVRRNNEIDWSASLIISRMKFNVGLSGYLSFQIKRFGSTAWSYLQAVLESDRYVSNTIPLIQDKVFTVPIHQRNDSYQLKVISTSPFPVTLSSMVWEGNYSTRYYRRA